MPKEAKEPLFCCGAQHKSANYHKRTVHQRHTKIYFNGHPEASFILRRNSVTSLFHCPKCDKSWAMATPIRNHIFLKCEGYAQYRSSASATSTTDAGELEANQSTSSIDSVESSAHADLSFQMPGERKTPTLIADKTGLESVHREEQVPEGLDSDASPATPSAADFNPSEEAPPSSVQVVDNLAPSKYATRFALEQASYITPMLRPAVWSPVAGTSSAAAADPGSNLDSFAYHGRSHLTSSRGKSSISTLTLTPSGSSTSKSSARTLSDDVFLRSLRHPTSHVIKPDPDAISGCDFVARYDLPAGALSSSNATRSPQGERSFSPYTAVQEFLDDLPRPLGHAASHFHKLGLVTDSDLDLVCTMPETWEEVGAVLQAGGITMIEWLMVKEALRARAE